MADFFLLVAQHLPSFAQFSAKGFGFSGPEVLRLLASCCRK